jgi:hypothetical protein
LTPGKKWSVELSKSALKALKRLDKAASLRILDRLGELAETDNPLRHKDVRSLAIFELDPDGRRIGVLVVIPLGKGY